MGRAHVSPAGGDPPPGDGSWVKGRPRPWTLGARKRIPPDILLVTDPGPDPDDIKALLVLGVLHKQGEVVLRAVVCNGGGQAEARARLALCVLDHIGVDVPVGVGSQGHALEPQPHEYRLDGYESVDAGRLVRGHELLLSTLRAAPPAGLTVVLISSLRDFADAIAEEAALVRSRVRHVAVQAGLERDASATHGWRADSSVNNGFDVEAAQAVYDFCFAHGVPLSVTSRHAVPMLPMQLARSFAERTYCPVMAYLSSAQFLGLEGLWQRLCRGELPARCTKQWYFETFCGVAGDEFEQEGLAQLVESSAIQEFLNGYVKPYDVVALMTALPRTRELFPPAETVRINGACHRLYLSGQQTINVSEVLSLLRSVYHDVVLATAEAGAQLQPQDPNEPPAWSASAVGGAVSPAPLTERWQMLHARDVGAAPNGGSNRMSRASSRASNGVSRTNSVVSLVSAAGVNPLDVGGNPAPGKGGGGASLTASPLQAGRRVGALTGKHGAMSLDEIVALLENARAEASRQPGAAAAGASGCAAAAVPLLLVAFCVDRALSARSLGLAEHAVEAADDAHALRAGLLATLGTLCSVLATLAAPAVQAHLVHMRLVALALGGAAAGAAVAKLSAELGSSASEPLARPAEVAICALGVGAAAAHACAALGWACALARHWGRSYRLMEGGAASVGLEAAGVALLEGAALGVGAATGSFEGRAWLLGARLGLLALTLPPALVMVSARVRRRLVSALLHSSHARGAHASLAALVSAQGAGGAAASARSLRADALSPLELKRLCAVGVGSMRAVPLEARTLHSLFGATAARGLGTPAASRRRLSTRVDAVEVTEEGCSEEEEEEAAEAEAEADGAGAGAGGGSPSSGASRARGGASASQATAVHEAVASPVCSLSLLSQPMVLAARDAQPSGSSTTPPATGARSVVSAERALSARAEEASGETPGPPPGAGTSPLPRRLGCLSEAGSAAALGTPGAQASAKQQAGSRAGRRTLSSGRPSEERGCFRLGSSRGSGRASEERRVARSSAASCGSGAGSSEPQATAPSDPSWGGSGRPSCSGRPSEEHAAVRGHGRGSGSGRPSEERPSALPGWMTLSSPELPGGRRRPSALVPSPELPARKAEAVPSRWRSAGSGCASPCAGSPVAQRKNSAPMLGARPGRRSSLRRPGRPSWLNAAASPGGAAAGAAHVDAYVVHSHHDDADEKRLALSRWARDFAAEHGRPPCVWLDELSADATLEPSAHVARMPLHLASAHSLLVLWGPTLVDRLWAAMELYAWRAIGGSLDDVHVLAVGSDERALNLTISSIDAFHCVYARARTELEDAHLLRAVELATVEGFNETVHGYLPAVQKAVLKTLAAKRAALAEQRSAALAAAPAASEPAQPAPRRRRAQSGLAASGAELTWSQRMRQRSGLAASGSWAAIKAMHPSGSMVGATASESDVIDSDPDSPPRRRERMPAHYGLVSPAAVDDGLASPPTLS